MGVPLSAFVEGDVHIEYKFEDVLFRYEKESGKYFCKRYGHADEHEVPHDFDPLNEAICSGVMTTAERYCSEGVPAAGPEDCFARLALKHQRTRPCWLSVVYKREHTRSGTIEVGTDGRLEVVSATAPAKELVEKAVAEINAQAALTVTYGKEAPLSVDKKSRDFDFALRLELEKWELNVYSESSFHHGRSKA